MRYRYIDFEIIDEMAEGDPAFKIEMLQSFIRSSTTIARDIKENIAKGDQKTIAMLLHKLKPTVQYVGTEEMKVLISSTEALCKESIDQNSISAALEQIDAGLHNMREEVEGALSQIQ